MPGDQIAHIIGAVTTLLWLLLAAYVIWLLRQPLTAAVSRLATFEAFGVKFALSGGAALHALQIGAEQHQPFDLILSDISRDLPAPDGKAGLAMLPRLRDVGFSQPVIFYVGRPEPGAGVPASAFGLTNRPDQLLQLVIDALSRVRARG